MRPSGGSSDVNVRGQALSANTTAPWGPCGVVLMFCRRPDGCWCRCERKRTFCPVDPGQSNLRLMKGNLRKCLAWFLFSQFLLPAHLQAEPDGATPPAGQFLIADNFRDGLFELSFTAGPLFSPTVALDKRPTLNYAVGALQLGYMLTPPSGEGFLRGNFEFAPEAFGASIFDGSGSYIAGGTLWLRYNFLPCDCRLAPTFRRVAASC